MARPVKATRLQGNLVRGAFSLFSLAFERPSDRRRIAAFGDELADTVEDGLSVEVDAKGERVGIAIRRHRKAADVLEKKKPRAQGKGDRRG